MVELIHEGVYYKDGQLLTEAELAAQGVKADRDGGTRKTLEIGRASCRERV